MSHSFGSFFIILDAKGMDRLGLFVYNPSFLLFSVHHLNPCWKSPGPTPRCTGEEIQPEAVIQFVTWHRSPVAQGLSL